MAERDERPAWKRLAIRSGAGMSAIAGAWLVAYGVVVVTAGHGKNAVSRPFWIAVTFVALAAILLGAVLVVLGNRSPPASSESSIGTRGVHG